MIEVEAVCACGDVLDVLDQLVDRSLVTAHEVGAATRYGMLETLREYARERLSERGEVRVMHDRHADFYVAVAGSLRLDELRAWSTTSVVSLSELENPLNALRWCVGHDTSPERAYRLLGPMWAVVHSRAAAEITDLAERALDRWHGVDDPLTDQVLGVAAVGHFVLGRPDRARDRALQAIAGGGDAAIARRASALVAYHFSRDVEEADRLLADVIAVAERCGSTGIAMEMTPTASACARRARRDGRRGGARGGGARARRGGRRALHGGLGASSSA